MKALLDTHTFLWWNVNSDLLSQTAHEIIQSGEVEIYLTAASVWEMSIKAHKGHLILPDTPEKFVVDSLAYYHFFTLPVRINHASRVFSLPDHHQDPFDRLLVAQCQVEDMTLLSADKIFRKYDLNVIW